MKSPEDYHTIFEEQSKLFKLEDVSVFDWMSEARKLLKPTSSYHFSLMKAKRIMIKRSKKYGAVIKTESDYDSLTCEYKSLFKKTTTIRHFSPSIIQYSIKLDDDKIRDIKQLLCLHYGEEWDKMAETNYFQRLFERMHHFT